MGLLTRYSFAAGPTGAPPERWPEASRLERAAGEHTLVMVVHPRCSCTRASIRELSLLMTRLHGRLSAYVLFVKPEGAADHWERTDLWTSASIISGVTVVGDARGEEAARFGAVTSGHVYLFRPDGALVFNGGITPSRSHQGDNVGRERIESLVRHGRAERDESAVYGCAIAGDSASGG